MLIILVTLNSIHPPLLPSLIGSEYLPISSVHRQYQSRYHTVVRPQSYAPDGVPQGRSSSPFHFSVSYVESEVFSGLERRPMLTWCDVLPFPLESDVPSTVQCPDEIWSMTIYWLQRRCTSNLRIWFHITISYILLINTTFSIMAFFHSSRR